MTPRRKRKPSSGAALFRELRLQEERYRADILKHIARTASILRTLSSIDVAGINVDVRPVALELVVLLEAAGLVEPEPFDCDTCGETDRDECCCWGDPELLSIYDEEMQRPVGANQHSEAVDNIHTLDRPSGTSAQAAIRRLRKERPDLLEMVKAEEYESAEAKKREQLNNASKANLPDSAKGRARDKAAKKLKPQAPARRTPRCRRSDARRPDESAYGVTAPRSSWANVVGALAALVGDEFVWTACNAVDVYVTRHALAILSGIYTREYSHTNLIDALCAMWL